MKFEGHNDGYTGRLLEEEVLAKVGGDWREQGFFTEEKSYEWVKSHQPWNPSDPNVVEGGPNYIANDLHYKVAEALQLEDLSELKFYTALDSPLDLYFGVDAFFEYHDAILTVDLTQNPHKLSHKADIIVRPGDLESEEAMENVASQIATYLGRRAQEVDRKAAERK